LQVGKVPAALPALQADLGLTLVQSGWVVAIFNLLAACIAIFLGTVSDRYGHVLVALCGMVITAVCGLSAGFSTTGTALLSLRALEGFGFLLTVASIPPLILRAASPTHRKPALAMWGMYMPVGSGLMLALSGPILMLADWRILWWITSGLILAMTLPVWLVATRLPNPPDRTLSRPGFAQTLRPALRRGPVLLGAIFMVYAASYLSLAGFLPLMLIEQDGMAPWSAALVSAIAVLCNGVGNGASGWLHNRGLTFGRLVISGSIGMALTGVVAFIPDAGAALRIAAACLFGLAGGLVPSSIFAEAPRHASNPVFLGTISGAVVQGAALGQLGGPPLTAALVDGAGSWSAAIPVMVICPALAIWFALLVPGPGKATKTPKAA